MDMRALKPSGLKPGMVCLLVVAAAAGAAAAIALADMRGGGTSASVAAGWLVAWLLLALAVLLGWRRMAGAKTNDPEALDAQRRANAYQQVAERFAHELNNQLGIMSNSAYLIERRSQDPRLEMPVQAILRATEAASKLGFHLHRLGGSHGAASQRLDLVQWLPGVEEVMRLALGKRAGLDLQPAPAAVQVYIHADALELALASLLAELGPQLEHGSRVDLSLHRMDAGDGWPMPAGAYVSLQLQMRYAAGAQRDLPGTDWMAAQDAPQASVQFLAEVVALDAGYARLREEAGGRLSIWLLLPEAVGIAEADA